MAALDDATGSASNKRVADRVERLDVIDGTG
jgi:hypothetical protein